MIGKRDRRRSRCARCRARDCAGPLTGRCSPPSVCVMRWATTSACDQPQPRQWRISAAGCARDGSMKRSVARPNTLLHRRWTRAAPPAITRSPSDSAPADSGQRRGTVQGPYRRCHCHVHDSEIVLEKAVPRVAPPALGCVDPSAAPVAQLDRAPDFEFGGQGFESLPARQFNGQTTGPSQAEQPHRAAMRPRSGDTITPTCGGRGAPDSRS